MLNYSKLKSLLYIGTIKMSNNNANINSVNNTRNNNDDADDADDTDDEK